jgi:hypothetical protein
MTVNVPYASGEQCQDLMFSTAGFASVDCRISLLP